jgi:hypothetical protein
MQAARSEPSEGRWPIRDRLQIFQWRNRLAATAAERQKFLWIIKADIKDLHVPKGRRFVPLLEILSDLVEAGVSVRLMHAKEPAKGGSAVDLPQGDDRRRGRAEQSRLCLRKVLTVNFTRKIKKP